MPSFAKSWPLHAALLLTFNLSFTWFSLVSQIVPEPYLDEFFHVPQAQKYCNDDYTWDPKITTPPGLYIVAKLFKPLLGCSTTSLRALNVGAICLICLVSYDILRTLRTPRHQDAPQHDRSPGRQTSFSDSTILLDANTALNIALFPPLFFFSALFYTDVMSTMTVLLSYSMLLKKKTASGGFSESLCTIFIGTIALFFRQTNIFWVAVFPAGLTVIEALKKSATRPNDRQTRTVSNIIAESWCHGAVYDCALQDAAELQEYGLFLVTAVIAVLKRPRLVLRVALPYVVLLGIFTTFVLWNGGVVLGDKSAHTATIHVPQMLYIWPYVTFFSAPLVLGPLFYAAINFLPKQFRVRFEEHCIVPRSVKLPNMLISALFILPALIAVHYNTIIHPYTLADNRHYVFYVFRILRRHPTIKYLAVSAYFICAWLVTNTMGESPNDYQPLKKKRDRRSTNIEIGRAPCQISFIAIWLAATALSVVTAPLVEPRYFIIPWIIWRLHVQSAPASLFPTGKSVVKLYNIRLGLETLWLIAINLTVAYMFLYRGFEWASEPGKVQRFLW